METIYTVSQLVYLIKESLEKKFSWITLVGEISNYKASSSGHLYFSLKDQKAELRSCLFRPDLLRNPQAKRLRDGDLVECYGQISVYPQRGSFQLIVKKITRVGAGGLKEKFDLLKKKLQEEGLFDLSRKKGIPSLPQKVAVVTALQGAALQDFINVYQRRSRRMNLVVVPSLVQGEEAPRSLVAALDKIELYNQKKPHEAFDLVVLTRGGGSLEDLWAFNDESLVRKVAQYSLPILCAVGHQVDYSLCDFAADMRAETPSAAAEMITQKEFELHQKLELLLGQLLRYWHLCLDQKKSQLGPLHPFRPLKDLIQHCHQLRLRWQKIQLHEGLLSLAERQWHLGELVETMCQRQAQQLRERFTHGEHLMRQLRSLDPKGVMKRGYAIVHDQEGKILKSKKDYAMLSHRAPISVEFFDGEVQAEKI